MDIFIHIIMVLVRDIVWDFIFFFIGYGVLRLLSFGTYPKSDDLKQDYDDHGHPWGLFLGSQHNLICLVGGLTVLLIWLI